MLLFTFPTICFGRVKFMFIVCLQPVMEFRVEVVLVDVCEEYIAFDLCWGCYGREAGRCSNLSLKRPELSCRLQTSFQHTHTQTIHTCSQMARASLEMLELFLLISLLQLIQTLDEPWNSSSVDSAACLTYSHQLHGLGSITTCRKPL